MRYKSKDLVAVVPTKDRPERIAQLLKSFSDQSCDIGRVIAVDGGDSIETVIDGFRDRLNIDYLRCHPPGQIRQRKLGLARVGEEFPLVLLIDDDIFLEPDAIEKMVDFWNHAPANTGGVGFNLVNVPPHEYSPFRATLGMSGEPGQVLKSGYNISIANQSEDRAVSWLAGGYTVYRHAVLKEFPQDELRTTWAVGEDVRLSYPIGKKYPLFVCAAARAHDTGQAATPPSPARARFQGRKECLAYLYLVERNSELSEFRCVLMIMSYATSLAAKALLSRSRSVHHAIGQFMSLWDFAKARFFGRSLKCALED